MLEHLPTLDLPLARSRHDRAAERRDEPDLLARLHANPETRALVVHGDSVAVLADRGREGGHLAFFRADRLPVPVAQGPTPPPRPDAADDPADVRRDTRRSSSPRCGSTWASTTGRSTSRS